MQQEIPTPQSSGQLVGVQGGYPSRILSSESAIHTGRAPMQAADGDVDHSC